MLPGLMQTTYSKHSFSKWDQTVGRGILYLIIWMQSYTEVFATREDRLKF